MVFWNIPNNESNKQTSKRNNFDIAHNNGRNKKEGNKQLIWYRYFQPIDEHKLLKHIINLQPRNKKRPDRIGKSWREGIDNEIKYR